MVLSFLKLLSKKPDADIAPEFVVYTTSVLGSEPLSCILVCKPKEGDEYGL